MNVNLHSPKISFGRQLKANEIKEYSATLQTAKKLVGQTGKTIFIMPSASLPQSNKFNSGIGHISSNIAQDYFKFLKTYLDINIIEDLPPGQVNTKGQFYSAYDSSAFALGNHQINPELLATKDFEFLLNKNDLNLIHNGNTLQEKGNFANFANVMNNDGTQNQVLKKAFLKFEQLPESSMLRKKFEQYKSENSFWLNFKRVDEPNQEFFKFKQFIADEHLKIGKEKLNKQGIKLFGDCLIGFTKDELNAFPNAFKQGHYIGMPNWHLPSLNYDNILDEASDSAKLLKAKIQLFAKRYDSIRFDVAWAYVTPLITPLGTGEIKNENKKELGDKLLLLIEKWVKEVKGEQFNLNDLIYEFDASPKVFGLFNQDGTLIDGLKNRVKIFGSTYMSDTLKSRWGFNQAFLDRHWSPDEYILGIGNHDPQPLRQIAKGIPEKISLGTTNIFLDHKEDAIPPLSKILKIPQELLQNPTEFAKAKWAEIMQSKHCHMFFMDVFGREERFDMQEFNKKVHPEKNYAYKVPTDYKKAYQDALSSGFGFNPMDSLYKLFKAKELDKTHPSLFKQIQKYKNILEEKETTILKNKNLQFLFYGIGTGIIFTAIAYYFTSKNQAYVRNDISNSKFLSINEFINKKQFKIIKGER